MGKTKQNFWPTNTKVESTEKVGNIILNYDPNIKDKVYETPQVGKGREEADGFVLYKTNIVCLFVHD